MFAEKISKHELVISVFGIGRIGLPTAAIFASAGFKVYGVDINQAVVEILAQGICHIDEPGLEELIQKNVNQTIFFTTDYASAVQESDICIICVPTPLNEDRAPDYSAIKDVASKIGENMKNNTCVLIESSISPTTAENLVTPLLEKVSNLKVNQDFYVIACPERANPGEILANFANVPRIIGGINKEVTAEIAVLYHEVTGAEIVQVSSPGTANAVKLTENIFRDVNIALVNELAVLYDRLGIDILEVIHAASTKYNFVAHYPGAGVGGPCLPANPYYIIQDGMQVNYIPFLIRVAREVNDRMPFHVVECIQRVLNEVGKPIKGTKILLLGLSYKPDVADLQISPALIVHDKLFELGADIRICDPHFAGKEFKGVTVAAEISEVIDGTECIVLLTAHKQFRDLDYYELAIKVSPLIIVDGRNAIDLERLPAGSYYIGIGRPLKQI